LLETNWPKKGKPFAVIAAKHSKSTAQGILRWHVQNGLTAIPKSIHIDRMKQNLEIFDYELDDDDLNKIMSLDSPLGRIGADPETADFS
jgi:2,5-diketo-D-gluconate reductase A